MPYLQTIATAFHGPRRGSAPWPTKHTFSTMMPSQKQGGLVVAITIRNVPVHVRDEIARRAKLRSQSTGQYVRELLSDHAGKPDKAEVLARIEKRAEAIGDIDVMSYIKRSKSGRY